MRARVDEDGKVHLELSAHELEVLAQAVDSEVAFHTAEYCYLEGEAATQELLAIESRRGRVAKRRRAGVFMEQAAVHKACARVVGDLSRVLHGIATPNADKG